MSYTTEGQIEKFLLQDIDPSFSSQISTWISVAEAWIDNYCNTKFGTGVNATKYYDGNGEQILFVDQFTGNPTVKLLDLEGNIIETLTEGTDYNTYPLNDTVKNSIRLVRSGTGLIGNRELIDGAEGGRNWNKGTKNISITADFNYGSVPEPIQLAATMIVAKIINEGLRGGQVKNEQLGSYNVTYDIIDMWSHELGIIRLIDPYRVIEL